MRARKTVADGFALVLSFTMAGTGSFVPAIADGVGQMQSPPAVPAITDGAGQVQSAPAHDQVEALDSQFIALYESARSDFLAHGDPIILLHRGAVTLINHGKIVTKIEYLPQQFQTLKTVDHINLAIFVALADHSDHLSGERIAQLKKFLAAILAARSQIEGGGLSKEQADRQQKIINVSVDFINQVVANNGCTRNQLNDYMYKMRPLTYDNVKDAVALELSNLNTAVRKLLALLSDDQTRALRVVVFGSHMARTEETHWQYFSRLLDEPVEGRRIIYFEGNGDDKDGLELLGAHLLDEQISLEYFGTTWRMHRDLLSAAAARWLDENPVKKPGEHEKFSLDKQ